MIASYTSVNSPDKVKILFAIDAYFSNAIEDRQRIAGLRPPYNCGRGSDSRRAPARVDGSGHRILPV